MSSVLFSASAAAELYNHPPCTCERPAAPQKFGACFAATHPVPSLLSSQPSVFHVHNFCKLLSSFLLYGAVRNAAWGGSGLLPPSCAAGGEVSKARGRVAGRSRASICNRSADTGTGSQLGSSWLASLFTVSPRRRRRRRRQRQSPSPGGSGTHHLPALFSAGCS